MSATKTKSYKATFILDLRKTEDDAAKVSADIAEVLGQIGATVSGQSDLETRAFARVTDRHLSQGHYIEIDFSTTASDTNSVLREKLRLDKRVKRIFVTAA